MAASSKPIRKRSVDLTFVWLQAVRTQVERVIDVIDESPLDLTQRRIDSYLLVLALHQVHRAAALALTDLPPASASLTQARGAIEVFEQAVPGFKDARDAVDHFDAYIQGIGDKQQPEVKRARRQARPDLGDAHNEFVSRIDGDFVITIGTAEVSALDAEEAASVLAHDLDQAVRLA